MLWAMTSIHISKDSWEYSHPEPAYIQCTSLWNIYANSPGEIFFSISLCIFLYLFTFYAKLLQLFLCNYNTVEYLITQPLLIRNSFDWFRLSHSLKYKIAELVVYQRFCYKRFKIAKTLSTHQMEYNNNIKWVYISSPKNVRASSGNFGVLVYSALLTIVPIVFIKAQ